MKSYDAQQEFQHFIAQRGTDIYGVSPRESLALMLAFYEAVRADDVDLEADGDMLLVQWGVSDQGQGARFSYNITRQFITEISTDEDDEEWVEQVFKQLSLTFAYDLNETLSALPHGNTWCYRPEELPAFTTYISEHPATQAIQDAIVQTTTLDFIDAN